MDIHVTHSFIARGALVRDDISVPVTIVGNYPRYGVGNVECKVVLEMEGWPSDFGTAFDYQIPIELRGKTEERKDIWSPEFQVTQASAGILHEPSAEDRFSLKGISTFFIEGDLSTFESSKGEIICYLSVTPTALAIFRVGFYLRCEDGTISRRGGERKGIRWNTPLGEAELLDNYDYIDEKVGFENVLVQFQKYQITLKIPPDRSVTSLKSLLVELKDMLDEPLLMLSFLSRQSVTWYEAKASFYSKDPATEFHRNASARHQQYAGYGPDIDRLQFNLPVDQQALKDGVFQTMLSNYEGSHLKDIIRQTIQYLLISHESGYFEARLGLVYAALESLVDGLSKHNDMTYLMGSNKFKNLSKDLKEIIFEKIDKILEEVFQEKISDKDVAKGIIGKLPELRRPPIRDRLLKLLEIYKLDKIRMDSDIITKIEGILNRRNAYIHTGVVDYDNHIDDFYFLQELIELWLLTLLDCPDTVINRHAFRKIILAR